MKKPSAAEQKAALEGLRSLPGSPVPMPGAAGDRPTRLHGRYATATVASATLHLYEWEIDWEAEFFDATAHGEFWKVWVPGDQQWTMRCRGYFVRSVATYLRAAASTTADPIATTVTAYHGITIDPAQALWVASGFISRATFSAPMAMVTQEMEIRGTGIPTDITIGT